MSAYECDTVLGVLLIEAVVVLQSIDSTAKNTQCWETVREKTSLNV